MRKSFVDWYWGRIHFNEFTMVYYVMNQHKGKDYGAWLISVDNQQILDVSTSVRIDGMNVNGFGLSSARRLEFAFKEREITVLCNQILDNGPFYMRYRSEARMQGGDHLEEKKLRDFRVHPPRSYPLANILAHGSHAVSFCLR